MENIIELNNVYKKYKLGTINTGTLVEDIQLILSRFKSKLSRDAAPTHNNESVKEIYALRNINLTVKRGEKIGIIGMNGAGKSTFLKLLSRITYPSDGNITIYGKLASMLEVGTGFDGELTGRENIYLNGAILGMSKKETEKKLESIIQFSECGDFIDTPVKRYSSGMYVKLAFAVMAHLDFDILIMDEVLAVGDMAFQTKCLNKMNELSDSTNKTILYVSHNMNTIRALCSRCIVLQKGEIIFNGNVEEAIEYYLSIKKRELGPLNDCAKYLRNDPLTNYKAIITHVSFENEIYIIPFGSLIRINLTIKCWEKVEDIHVRIIINQTDDTPCGTSISDGIPLCSEGAEKKLMIDFDASSIVPGKYFMTFQLFHPDGLGEQVKFDFIKHAIMFEVISSTHLLYNWNWSSKFWGCSAYPNLQIKEIR